jgi:hypothetical protein
MDDARSRWRAEHRRRRIRARKLAPWRRAAVISLFVAAAAFAVVSAVVDIMWFTGTFVCLFAGLRLDGMTFGEIFGSGGSTDAYIDGGGGDSSGDSGC